MAAQWLPDGWRLAGASPPTLEMILAKAWPGIRFNEHMEGDGETAFRHACKFGLEGIVSKRKHSTYRSGRSPRLAQNEELGCTGREARRPFHRAFSTDFRLSSPRTSAAR
jgi:hypothetical protein